MVEVSGKVKWQSRRGMRELDLMLLPFTSVVSLPNSPALALLSRADENKRRVEMMSIPAHFDAVLCFVSI